MIPVCKPCWGREEEEAALRVMRSGRLIQGPEVARFEEAVAQYVGVRQAVACSSGTTALHLALMAMGVGLGDKVLVPAFTFVATANAVLACGAKPKLVDIYLETFNAFIPELDDTAAMIAVHAFGQPVYASSNTGLLLEDAACALGSLRSLQGQAAIFSFHATKVITTGEGGMVMTDDAALAERCRFLRDQKHGKGMAYNYRMTEIQGAIGQEQMKRLYWILGRRAQIAALYDAEFAGAIRARIPPAGGNYQSYVLLLDKELSRSRAIAMLAEHGVEALPATQFLGDMPHLETPGLPNARYAGTHAMRVPIWPGMSEAAVEQVIEAVKAVLG